MSNFQTFSSDVQKVHNFQTATGLRFVLCTDPSHDDLMQHLIYIFKNIYVECAHWISIPASIACPLSPFLPRGLQGRAGQPARRPPHPPCRPTLHARGCPALCLCLAV